MPIVKKMPRKFLAEFRRLKKDSEMKDKEMRKLKKQVEHFENLWEQQKITNIHLLTENIELKDERRKRRRQEFEPESMAKRMTHLSEALAREEMRGDYYERCYNELYAAKRIAMAEERRRTLRFVYNPRGENAENADRDSESENNSETESSEEVDSDNEDQEEQVPEARAGPYLFKDIDDEEADRALLNC